MIADFNARLLEFLDTSPTPFHAVASLSKRLNDAGFSQVADGDRWHLQPGGRYFVVRNDSAIVAFVCGTEPFVENGIRVAGAHTDSPCLKVKPVPVVKKQGYVQLGVEVYGGALLNPWFDRDLSLAGRVDYLAGDGSLQSMLIDLHRPVAFIPSLAIHLDRTANEGRKINPQTEMAPLISQLSADEDFSLEAFLLDHIRSLPECETAAEVLSHELMFYDTQPAKLLGLKDEFLASARLDNLLSCFLACEALCDAPRYAHVCCSVQ